jgi:hypothetical protein
MLQVRRQQPEKADYGIVCHQDERHVGHIIHLLRQRRALRQPALRKRWRMLRSLAGDKK